mmetsp:Transcript_98253/g.174938  ORF Transcript_98253/g.174938 Transcript_98253/m.174938 type:complete len:94 (-) Transcript_98253:732-1013(-)
MMVRRVDEVLFESDSQTSPFNTYPSLQEEHCSAPFFLQWPFLGFDPCAHAQAFSSQTTFPTLWYPFPQDCQRKQAFFLASVAHIFGEDLWEVK